MAMAGRERGEELKEEKRGGRGVKVTEEKKEEKRSNWSEVAPEFTLF